jgi:hypothetical protein
MHRRLKLTKTTIGRKGSKFSQVEVSDRVASECNEPGVGGRACCGLIGSAPLKSPVVPKSPPKPVGERFNFTTQK